MDETKLRYLPLEKAALALLQAAKKLPHYFQASTITVLTDLPLKMLLQCVSLKVLIPINWLINPRIFM